jgi:ABC-type Zn uptake system ZnuABC Zn-binding protein ZnuA
MVVAICAVSLIGAACAPRTALGGKPVESFLTPPNAIEPVPLAPGETLRVVATTSILADVVGRIGGDQIDLVSLVPVGVDPHVFEPSPADAQTLAEADVIFINGFGLETFMADLLQQAGGEAAVVSASLGITPLAFEEEDHPEVDSVPEEHDADPHTWLDPNNVIHWTENIEAALRTLDPDHAETYAANAEAYRSDLAALDAEIRDMLSAIPPQDRKLVTDHDELGYFANEYGFTVVGTVIPGSSSLAEPSAAELAALLDRVRAEDVPAVFVSSIISPSLVEAFAGDAGIAVVVLYAHSLTKPDGPAPSYLTLMRYNAEAIAAALAP